MANFCAESI